MDQSGHIFHSRILLLITLVGNVNVNDSHLCLGNEYTFVEGLFSMAILAQNKKVFMVIIIFDAIFMMDMAQVFGG